MTKKRIPLLKNVTTVLPILLVFYLGGCADTIKESALPKGPSYTTNTQPIFSLQNTTFPQIHTNLNGMVREFVRTMHQDQQGNYWFGTNGDGIIRYDGHTLEKMNLPEVRPNFRVLGMVEDTAGALWFGTSEGLLKYDGKEFTVHTIQEAGLEKEIWGLTIDHNGLLWLGTTAGVYQYNGETFTPFPLPASTVAKATPMLSNALVFTILEDRQGTLWFATDGHGVYTYAKGEFTQRTTQNGLADNNVADLMEDRNGRIWIGSFYGGVSLWDGTGYTHFTKEGTIAGEETYNFLEDSRGAVWFTAEGQGVYRYDGTNFTQYTTEDGLTSNVVLSIFEDHKGQLWFGTWQGLCIFEGETFVNASKKEPWTN